MNRMVKSFLAAFSWGEVDAECPVPEMISEVQEAYWSILDVSEIRRFKSWRRSRATKQMFPVYIMNLCVFFLL